ncbi:hypothetical protein [Falsirhodobacter sp. 20TX0035]|uniref:hypothetical protein n=1 Tax=Falsirhodobacter sp. 20TX0035 TaxID=3022019 RepID=UPI00232CB7C8|nr:hypothetical protein [Falsirhodobacter sp. 20TX0035]MDB6455113.1 hypothetical protein [Falsirhodobacter sp. 20TX0035]
MTLDHTNFMSNGAAFANGDSGVFRRMTLFDTFLTDAEMQAWVFMCQMRLQPQILTSLAADLGELAAMKTDVKAAVATATTGAIIHLA